MNKKIGLILIGVILLALIGNAFGEEICTWQTNATYVKTDADLTMFNGFKEFNGSLYAFGIKYHKLWKEANNTFTIVSTSGLGLNDIYDMETITRFYAVGDSSRIFQSNDGTVWSQTTNISNAQKILKIAKKEDTLAVAALMADNFLRVFVKSGDSWIMAKAFNPPVGYIAGMAYDSSGRLYVVTEFDTHIYYSDNPLTQDWTHKEMTYMGNSNIHTYTDIFIDGTKVFISALTTTDHTAYIVSNSDGVMWIWSKKLMKDEDTAKSCSNVIKLNAETYAVLCTMKASGNVVMFKSSDGINWTWEAQIVHSKQNAFPSVEDFYKKSDETLYAAVNEVMENAYIKKRVCIENNPPIANAGPDKEMFLGESTSLDGSASSDTDGTITEWKWEIFDGLNLLQTLFGKMIGYTPKDTKKLTVKLIVKDDKGATANDTATITVNGTLPQITVNSNTSCNWKESSLVAAPLKEGFYPYAFTTYNNEQYIAGKNTTTLNVEIYKKKLVQGQPFWKKLKELQNTGSESIIELIVAEGKVFLLTTNYLRGYILVAETLTSLGTYNFTPYQVQAAVYKSTQKKIYVATNNTAQNVGQVVVYANLNNLTENKALSDPDLKKLTCLGQVGEQIIACNKGNTTVFTVNDSFLEEFGVQPYLAVDDELIAVSALANEDYILRFVSAKGILFKYESDNFKVVGKFPLDKPKWPIKFNSIDGKLYLSYSSSLSQEQGNILEFSNSWNSYSWNPQNSLIKIISNVLKTSEGIFTTATYEKDNSEFAAMYQLDCTQAANQPPTAKITVNDQDVAQITINPQTITVGANQSSDPENKPLTYKWEQLSGPMNFDLSKNTQNSVVLGFADVPAIFGTYEFKLTVTDDKGATGTDTIKITVNPAGANQPPTANAGLDQTITLGQTAVLDGSASTDPEGDAMEYSWQIYKLGDLIEQSTGTSANPKYNFTPDSIGEYDAVLKVWSLSTMVQDSMKITVLAQGANLPPTAKINVSNENPTIGEIVQIDCLKSTDSDGNIAKCSWKQFNPQDNVTQWPLTITEEKDVAIELTVTDDKGATGTATLTITPKIPEFTIESSGKYKWQKVTTQKIDLNVIDLLMANDGKIYVGGKNSEKKPAVFVSEDGGKTFTQKGNALTTGIGLVLKVFMDSKGNLFAGTSTGKIFKFENNAWVKKHEEASTETAITDFIETDNILLASTYDPGKVIRSKDNGNTWTASSIDLVTGSDKGIMFLYKGADNLVYAGGSSGFLLKEDPTAASTNNSYKIPYKKDTDWSEDSGGKLTKEKLMGMIDDSMKKYILTEKAVMYKGSGDYFTADGKFTNYTSLKFSMLNGNMYLIVIDTAGKTRVLEKYEKNWKEYSGLENAVSVDIGEMNGKLYALGQTGSGDLFVLEEAKCTSSGECGLTEKCENNKCVAVMCDAGYHAENHACIKDAETPPTPPDGDGTGGNGGSETPPVTCDTNSKCKADEYCKNKSCTKLGCKTGEIITDHKCVKEVEKEVGKEKEEEEDETIEPIGPAKECKGDYSCKSNEKCVDGKCKTLKCKEEETAKNHKCTLKETIPTDQNALIPPGEMDWYNLLLQTGIVVLVIALVLVGFFGFKWYKGKKEEQAMQGTESTEEGEIEFEDIGAEEKTTPKDLGLE